MDVTPRRVQAFRCRPGESVRWSFGAASGVATASADGSVTVPALEVETRWQVLTLTRDR